MEALMTTYLASCETNKQELVENAEYLKIAYPTKKNHEGTTSHSDFKSLYGKRM